VRRVDVREPCAEVREDGEASPRAGAPRRVQLTNDGDVGERNNDCGGVIGVLR